MGGGAGTIAVGMNARLFPLNWRPLREEAAFAVRVGFDALQIVGYDQGIDAERLGEPLPQAAAALRAAGLSVAIEVVVRLRPGGRTRSGATALEVLRANLPAIDALGSRRVHLHIAPVDAWDEAEVERLEHVLLDDLAAGVELARRHGFALGLEHNEPRLRLFGSPARCRAALDAVPDLGFTWDFNHTPPEDLDDVRAVGPRLTLVHVSDCPLPELNAHYPLGQGTLDVAAYCRVLREARYAGPAILEIGGHPRFGGFGRDTDAALADSHARLRAALAAAGSFAPADSAP